MYNERANYNVYFFYIFVYSGSLQILQKFFSSLSSQQKSKLWFKITTICRCKRLRSPLFGISFCFNNKCCCAITFVTLDRSHEIRSGIFNFLIGIEYWTLRLVNIGDVLRNIVEKIIGWEFVLFTNCKNEQTPLCIATHELL